MALIIETGVGVRGANAYVNAAYVTNYLTVRNRANENGWNAASDAVKEGAIIAATDYIDKRFGSRFKGVPAIIFDETYAIGYLSFGGVPGVNETTLLGDDVYKFVTTLTGASYEVLRGASAALSAAYLNAAINGGAGGGVTYSLSTPQSRHAGSSLGGAVLTLTARAPGSSGPLTVLVAPATNVVATAFAGGYDGGIQPLCWPRNYAYDQAGQAMLGVPDKLKQAVAEYAVRAAASPLMDDPDTTIIGVTSKTEVVGPITESFKYSGGVTIASYPAADRIMSSLLLGSGQGRVIRG